MPNAMTKDAPRCTACGKANPVELWGYHVTELCVCGLGKVGKKWVWLRTVTTAPPAPVIAAQQLDMFGNGL